MATFAKMLTIKKKYIVNESNERVAVQLDIETYEKIEQLLEDYVLGERMKENRESDRLKANEAKAQYEKMRKSSR